MKNALILLTISTVFCVGCGSRMDPNGPCIVRDSDYDKGLVRATTEFDDGWNLLMVTPKIAASSAIVRLQDARLHVRDLSPPACAADATNALADAMDARLALGLKLLSMPASPTPAETQLAAGMQYSADLAMRDAQEKLGVLRKEPRGVPGSTP